MTMRNARLTAGIAAAVLGWISLEATAQNPASKSDVPSPEYTFKGEVKSVNRLGVIVRGEFTSPSFMGSTRSKRRSVIKTVPFAVETARITRGGWRPCEAKDIEKGTPVTVTFVPPRNPRAKRLVATRVEITNELSDTDKEPALGKTGKLLFEDDFERSEIMPTCRPGMGFWEIQDGVITGTENPADDHAATLSLQPFFPYKDIVADFSFKFDGARSLGVSLDDKNYKEAHAGHICRVGFTLASVSLGDSKFGSMKNEIYEKVKDPKTTDKEKKELYASIKDKSTSFKIALEAGKWYQGRIEIVGDEMLVSIDYQPVGYFKSEGIDHPTKTRIGFSVAGKSLQLDNIKVWEATPREDWPQNIEAAQAAMQKP